MARDTSEFDDFVKRQLQQAKGRPESDWAADELQQWLGHLEKLYADAQVWLGEYIKSGSITFTFANIDMHEEDVGSYTARVMVIHIGREQIELVPIGTMLIGTKGRVDVNGRAGTARLALINRATTSARQMIKVNIRSATQPVISEIEQPSEKVDWVWKIVSRPPSLAFTDLNKDSFLRTILEVSNG